MSHSSLPFLPPPPHPPLLSPTLSTPSPYKQVQISLNASPSSLPAARVETYEIQNILNAPHFPSLPHQHIICHHPSTNLGWNIERTWFPPHMTVVYRTNLRAYQTSLQASLMRPQMSPIHNSHMGRELRSLFINQCHKYAMFLIYNAVDEQIIINKPSFKTHMNTLIVYRQTADSNLLVLITSIGLHIQVI